MAFQTQAQNYPDGLNRKLGIRIGFLNSTVTGNEFQNATIQFGLTGGAYVRYKLGERLSLQHELNFAYRGSRFNNNEGEYHLLSLLYFETPLLFMIHVNEENNFTPVIGGQYGHLMRSDLFKKGTALPEFSDLNLGPHDFSLAAGMHFNFGVVGLQTLVKWSLTDMNNGLREEDFDDLKPALGRGEEIKNLSLDISLYF